MNLSQQKIKELCASFVQKGNCLDKLYDAFFKEKTRIALDIGSHSVKVVSVKETAQGPRILKAGSKEISVSQETDAVHQDEKITVDAIKNLWKEQRIRGKRVRVVISDPSIYSRHISVPDIEEEELVKAIKWQAEKYIPFPIEESSVDYQEVASSSNKVEGQREVVIVAVENKVIDKYLDILRAAKLRPTVLDVSPLALAKLYLNKYPISDGEILPILDVGDKSTYLIVLKKGSILLIKKIEVTGSHLTTAVSKKFSVSLSEAEKIKRTSALSGEQDMEQDKKSDIFLVLEPLLSDLVEQIKRSIAYCERDLSSGSIHRLLLAGGGAQLSGINVYLSTKLGVPVENMTPIKEIDLIQKDAPSDGLYQKIGPALGEAL